MFLKINTVVIQMVFDLLYTSYIICIHVKIKLSPVYECLHILCFYTDHHCICIVVFSIKYYNIILVINVNDKWKKRLGYTF